MFLKKTMRFDKMLIAFFLLANYELAITSPLIQGYHSLNLVSNRLIEKKHIKFGDLQHDTNNYANAMILGTKPRTHFWRD